MLSTTKLSASRGRRAVPRNFRLQKALHWLRATCLLFFLTASSSSWAQFDYSVYNGSWSVLPDFTSLSPVLTGSTNVIDVSVRNRNDDFGLVFTNQLTVSVAANYEFLTTSDDGSKLYIENTVVVDNDGLHAPATETGQIFLNAGTYSLRVEFFERGGGEVIDVQYRVAGGSFTPIPPDGQLNGVVPGVSDAGSWGPVITWPHIAISAANLPDGRVLTWSSTETDSFPSNREFTHSAVFNPADNSFIDTSSNFHDMFCAGVSMLETGEIVASGGNPDDSRTSVFNPNNLTWEPLAEMFDRRWYASNVTLPNNDVFSTFGKSAGNRSEKYNADANQWTRTPNASMQTLLDEHNAIGGMEWFPLLAVQPDGKVFHGGPTLTLHSFDPVAGSPNEVHGQATGGRARKWGNIVTYDAGKVLLIGGSEPRNTVANRVTASNVYRVDLNGTAPVITQGGSMNFGRALSNTVVLPNGEVLVIGGNTNGLNFNDQTSVFPAEIYNPDSDSWRVVDSIDIPRNYHSTALLLKDGRVLSAGGGACGNCNENHLDGQIFSPPYLFNSDGSPASRPTLSGVAEQAGAGNTIVVNASADTQRFTMVRLSATTHHQNTDQRLVPIESTDNGDGTFNLTFNDNPNVLIPGYYWIFAVNANDTPSVGETVQILRTLAGGTDRDGDGVPDSEDAFPDDPNESVDTDGDGVGDNGDVFPNDPSESQDTDGDSIGNNADPTPYGAGYVSRHIRLTALSEVNGNPWASAAEVNLLGTDGLPIDRSPWIATASSSETVAENGNPANVLDGNVNTSWRAEYSTGNPTLPHYLYIDLGSANAITAFLYQSTTADADGAIRSFEIHLSDDGVAWGDPVLVGEFADSDTDTVILPVIPDYDIAPLPQAPRNSSTILVENSTGVDRIWNVNPDNDLVSVSSTAGTLIQEIPVGDAPWTLAKSPLANRILVTNKNEATISVIDTDTLTVIQTVAMPLHSKPHGIVFDSLGSAYYVVLEATRQVQKRDAVTHAVIATAQLSGVPRHLAVSYDDSRLLVSNFITPPAPGESTQVVDLVNAGAEVFVVDPGSMALTNTIALAHDNRGISESSGPGLPNYLNAPVISFDNVFAYVPSKKDNIGSGLLRASPGMTFESTVRANGSKIILGSETEESISRIDFDNASLATGAAFSGDSRYLMTALETSRELSVYDTVNNFELMRLPTGRAPQGVALSSDGTVAYVHNFMDRSISRFDLTAMLGTNLPVSNILPSISVVTTESLSATVLNGKQLFYDGADDRLALDNYMSCASCHNEGDSDGRVWDLSSLDEGLRNTISLQGNGVGHGPLHWTANFDEVQDFEAQIRILAAGTGLMSDADFNAGSRREPLGDPKAGLSADLDALAAYVESLVEAGNSPYRASNGDLTADGIAGRDVFADKNCASCHSGPAFSDSESEAMHDVGTIKQPTSGSRLGGPLTALDTPTLVGVWATAPYLHDGSAATLQDAIAAHTALGISYATGELDLLASYVAQIDDIESLATQPDRDGDGFPDNVDAFPDDPSEWQDSDGDGTGDNADAFDNDPTETSDRDGDGVGDNGDAFPDDPLEWADVNGNGIGDNSERDLVGAWGFDDPSGDTVFDSSIAGQDGTLGGAATRSANGYFGSALETNGSSGYVDLGGFDVNGSGLTLMAWINADDFGVSDARILSKSTGSASNDHIFMLSTIGSTPQLRFRLRTNGSTTTLIGSGGTLSAGNWIHAAATYDGSTMRLYQDGVEVGSTAKTGAVEINSAVALWIASNPGSPGQVFDGRIDDVKIFSKALTSAEIQTEMVTPATINDTQAPAAPPAFVATPLSGSAVGLSWGAATDNLGVAGYRVRRDGAVVGTTTELGYTDSGLLPSTVYSYTVTAFDAAGLESPEAGPEQAQTLTPDTVPPSVPAVFNATAVSATRVDLSWNPATDNVGVMEYRVYRDGGLLMTLAAPTTGYSDLTAQPETNYTYSVSARDFEGNESNPTVTEQAVLTPEQDDLLGAWGFEEPSGNAVIDSSGTGQDGTLGGVASRSANGYFGSTLETNGSSGYVDLGGFDVDASELTLMAWINADDFGVSDARILSKSTGSASNDHILMLSTIGSTPRLRFRLRTNGNTTTLIGAGGTLSAGTWIHAAATYDGSTMRLYQDGIEVGSAAKTGAVEINPAVAMWIASNPGSPGQVFDGRIDEVKIFNRALTAAEIQGEMATPVLDPNDFEPPTPPTGLTATPLSSEAIRLNWGPASDNIGVTGYRIRRGGSEIGTTTDLEFTDSGLSASSTYSYTVTAFDAKDLESVAAGPAEATTLTPDTVAPTVPGAFSATAISATRVDMNWTQATDNVGVMEYRIYRDGELLVTLPAPAAGYSDLSALPETNYVYSISARDFEGNESNPVVTEQAVLTPEQDDLLGAWGFEEPSGDIVFDSSSAGQDGTLGGGAARSVNGYFGAALETNGSSGYVDLGGFDAEASELTLMAWINADDFGVSDARILSKSTGSASNDHIFMLSTIGSTPQLRFRLRTNGSTATLIGAGGTLSAGTWIHATATYDGSTMRLYQDGVEVGNTAKGGPVAIDPAVALWIASNPGSPGQVFDGRIDEVKIFNRALTPVEIQTEMVTPLSAP